MRVNCSFQLEGRPIDIVNNFNYLGFGFSTQLSFSEHVKTINSKARAKCGLLFTRLPIIDLPLSTVLDLFSIFILPTYLYGLPLWYSNCSASSLQMVDATFTKYLKRYLHIPSHSNNASVHFLTSTIPLSKTLARSVPNAIGSLSFPPILHGHRLSFFPTAPSPDYKEDVAEIIEKIPTEFWLSRMPHNIPQNHLPRKHLMREILDSNHLQICQTKTFHPKPLPSCVCIHCGGVAHVYHNRFCDP